MGLVVPQAFNRCGRRESVDEQVSIREIHVINKTPGPVCLPRACDTDLGVPSFYHL